MSKGSSKVNEEQDRCREERRNQGRKKALELKKNKSLGTTEKERGPPPNIIHGNQKTINPLV